MKTMQTWQRLTLGLLVLAALALWGDPATAASSAGPYYATPAWDQKLDCPAPATCPRFIVLSNWSSAAVLDRETGLVWEQSPSTGTFPWFDADPTLTAAWHCNTLTVGGRKGWRLPTVQELASLVDPSQSNPALPAGHPFSSNVQSSLYWSATTFASSTSDAWLVNLDPGTVSAAIKTGLLFVWCVRGGQGVDPQ